MTDETAVKTGAELDAEWLDILEGAEEEAEKGRERLNFGQLSVAPRYVKWVDDGGSRKPQEIDAATYAKTPDRVRSLELVFGVNIQEFNPTLDWTYSRNVGVGSLDWNRILKPSIEAIMGDESMDGKAMSPTLGKLRGVYVQVADVQQTPTKKKPDPQYRTIQFRKVYETRQACYDEWYALYGESAAEAAAAGKDPLAPATDFAGYWADWDLEAEVAGIAALVEEYKTLETVASDYYDQPVESVVRALTNGGMKVPDIAKLSPNLTPAKVKKILE